MLPLCGLRTHCVCRAFVCVCVCVCARARARVCVSVGGWVWCGVVWCAFKRTQKQQLLTRHEIAHWIDYGTLLGLARHNGSLVPWEYDADICLMLADFQTLISLKQEALDSGAFRRMDSLLRFAATTTTTTTTKLRASFSVTHRRHARSSIVVALCKVGTGTNVQSQLVLDDLLQCCCSYFRSTSRKPCPHRPIQRQVASTWCRCPTRSHGCLCRNTMAYTLTSTRTKSARSTDRSADDSRPPARTNTKNTHSLSADQPVSRQALFAALS